MTVLTDEAFLDRTSDSLMPQSLGEALRMLRRRSHATRDDFARLTGVSAGAVSNYENDVSVPPATTLRRMTTVLADLLGVDPAGLWLEIGGVMDRLEQPAGEAVSVSPQSADDVTVGVDLRSHRA